MDIRSYARLACISLTQEEEESLSKECDEILAFFATLRNIPERNESSTHVSSVELREDIPAESLSTTQALANSSFIKDAHIVGPKTL